MSEISSIGGVPSDIQAKGADAIATYKAAQQLEQTFLQQLTTAMNPVDDSDPYGDDGSDDGSDDSSSDGTSDLYGSTMPYSDLIPGALAQGMSDAGGIGLARTIYNQLEGEKG